MKRSYCSKSLAVRDCRVVACPGCEKFMKYAARHVQLDVSCHDCVTHEVKDLTTWLLMNEHERECASIL